MSDLKIYSRFNTPGDSGVDFTEPSLAQQHFAEECDVNNIVSRAIQTGDVSVFTASDRAHFYDTTVARDYAEAMALMDDVNDDFNSLPSQVREYFGHDVSNYLAFMSNPDIDKAVELGLLERSSSVEGSLPTSSKADKPQSGASVADPAASTDAEPGTSPS